MLVFELARGATVDRAQSANGGGPRVLGTLADARVARLYRDNAQSACFNCKLICGRSLILWMIGDVVERDAEGETPHPGRSEGECTGLRCN